MYCPRGAISSFLPLPGHRLSDLIARSHRALAVGGAAGTVAGVPQFQPCSAFPMPGPWLCPRGGSKLRAQLALYPELNVQVG